MPSSISSSEQNPVTMLSELARPLPTKPLLASMLLGILVYLGSMTAWEIHWRSEGAEPSFRNSFGLWAIQRRRINQGEGDHVVMVGSSRILFNTQLSVWEEKSGESPIQLALEGTSPLAFMEDLAEDPDFTGTLLVGVTPGLYFSGFEYRAGALEHFRDESPSQWLGQRISMLIEPLFAWYEPDFALFTILQRQPWPKREGVVDALDVRKLSIQDSNRSTRMWSRVETDPEYAELAKLIWAQRFRPIDELSDDERQKGIENTQKQIDRTVDAVGKLQAKGVEVIFIRNPSEGFYAMEEPMYTPRSETWDVIIEKTGALGIHWEDHPELQGYWLPESSHIAGSQADDYTAALYDVIQRERKKHQQPK